MRDIKPQFYLSRRSGISGLLLAGFLALALPAKATIVRQSDYRACAFYLQEAGIPAGQAADACSAALKPRDLSTCVSDIDRQTDIPPADALLTCRRVRRPLELGTCVVDISLYTQELASLAILDNCRRALLPERFSKCVVGLGLQTELPANQLMANCLDGRDRPRDFYPILTTPGAAPLTPTTPGAPPPLDPLPGIPQIQ